MRGLFIGVCRNLQNTACVRLFEYAYFMNKYGILDIIIAIINHHQPLIGPRSIEDDIKTFEDDVK